MTEVMAAERFNCFQTYTTAKANIKFLRLFHVCLMGLFPSLSNADVFLQCKSPVTLTELFAYALV